MSARPPVAYLAALLEAEMGERAERKERRCLVEARFPVMKRLEDFSYEDNPSLSPAVIAALAEGGWIADRESVIQIGESGTGKTMLATGLGVAACRQGRRVRFTTLVGLTTELAEAESRRELARVVGRYARTELVVLDELGYLALPEGAAKLVFQVISERHERGSQIVTSNLPFGEWGKVFPESRLAKAVVDHITHWAHFIETGSGELEVSPPARSGPRLAHPRAGPERALRAPILSVAHRRRRQTGGGGARSGRVDSSERRNAEIDRGVRWTWWNKAMGITGGMFLRGSVSSS